MHAPVTIKVCGITEDAAARAAVDAGADHLGLVFADSPRRVTLEEADRLVAAVDARWVGVFVDPDVDRLAAIVDRLGLHAVQLHGDESPEACGIVRSACGRPVWKALRWDAAAPDLEAYARVADALLVDSSEGGRFGGTGRTLPWERLAARLPARPRRVPILLAGGLDPDNVALAIETVDPDGVDASSRLESAPGRKDVDRVRRFVAAARAAAGAAADDRAGAAGRRGGTR